ncbi:MAG: glycosyltransferase family protein [Cellulophaga sp.]
MKIIAVTQARVGSTRLPGKILMKISGKSLLEIHLNRILKSKLITKLKVATTNEQGVEEILKIAESCGVDYFQGDTYNVLDRFYNTVKDEAADYVVRLTSDCPLIDAELIDLVIAYTLKHSLDYCSNSFEERFPDGQDIEVFKFSALEKAWKEAKLDSEKEHVTPFIYNNSTFKQRKMFRADGYSIEEDYHNVRLTVDEEQDFRVVKKLIEEIGLNASWRSYTQCYLNNSEIRRLNSSVIRNEGYLNSINKENNGK